MVLRFVILLWLVFFTAASAQPNNSFAPYLPTGPGPWSGSPAPDRYAPQVPPEMYPGVPHLFCVSTQSPIARNVFVTNLFQSSRDPADIANELNDAAIVKRYQVTFTCTSGDRLAQIQKHRDTEMYYRNQGILVGELPGYVVGSTP